MLAKINAFLEGKLLPEEVDPGLVQLARAHQAHRDKTDKARSQKEARDEAKTATPRRTSLLNKRLFVDMAEADQDAEPDVQEAIEKHRMPVVLSRVEAQVFMCSKPADPGRRTLWAAMLCGGTIVDATFMQSGGARGISLTYQAAIRTPRSIWISPAFANAHPALRDVVRDACGTRESKWKLLSTRASFLAAQVKMANRPAAQRRPLDVVALVAPVDKVSQEHG